MGSLSVHVFLAVAGGERDVLDPPSHGESLAGFESWRHSVWGSPQVKALGAEFFPRLAEDDLYVEPEQVDAFLHECDLLRTSLEVIAPAPSPLNPTATYFVKGDDGKLVPVVPPDPLVAFRETVSRRLRNIESATAATGHTPARRPHRPPRPRTPCVAGLSPRGHLPSSIP